MIGDQLIGRVHLRPVAPDLLRQRSPRPQPATCGADELSPVFQLMTYTKGGTPLPSSDVPPPLTVTEATLQPCAMKAASTSVGSAFQAMGMGLALLVSYSNHVPPSPVIVI